MQDKNRLLLLTALLLALGVILVDSWLVTVPRMLGALLLGLALLLTLLYWLKRPRSGKGRQYAAATEDEQSTAPGQEETEMLTETSATASIDTTEPEQDSNGVKEKNL